MESCDNSLEIKYCWLRNWPEFIISQSKASKTNDLVWIHGEVKILIFSICRQNIVSKKKRKHLVLFRFFVVKSSANWAYFCVRQLNDCGARGQSESKLTPYLAGNVISRWKFKTLQLNFNFEHDNISNNIPALQKKNFQSSTFFMEHPRAWSQNGDKRKRLECQHQWAGPRGDW